MSAITQNKRHVAGNASVVVVITKGLIRGNNDPFMKQLTLFHNRASSSRHKGYTYSHTLVRTQHAT